MARGLGAVSSNRTLGLAAGVSTFLATPSSANLAAALTDETGSGALNFGASSSGLVRVGGGTLSGASTTFSAVFSATYNSYLVDISNLLNSGGAELQVQLGLNGTPATATDYNTMNSVTAAASITYGTRNAVAQFFIGVVLSTATGAASFTLQNPFLAKPTHLMFQQYRPDETANMAGTGRHTLSTSYNDLIILPQAGTFSSGTVNIYGYALS